MNSYIFGLDELKCSVLLTVFYSICGIPMIIVSPSFTTLSLAAVLPGVENELSWNRNHNFGNVGKPEFDRIMQRRQASEPASGLITNNDYNSAGVNSDTNKDKTTTTTSPESDKTKNSGHDFPAVVPVEPQATLGLPEASTTTEKSSDQNKVNCSLESNVNRTECLHLQLQDSDYENSLLKKMSDNKEMLLRTLYVTLGVTSIIVVYFVARAIWLRQKRTKSRKYRIIAQNGDQRDLEMEPLGDGKDDDDEDYTVFEVNGRKK